MKSWLAGVVLVGAMTGSCFAQIAGAAVGAAAETPLRVEGQHFLLKGKPFQILSGEVEYARVPRADWRDRLRKIKAMGLNTITVYVFWNLHEMSPGVFDFSGQKGSSAWLHGQPDFPEMIRFIVQQVTTSSEWGEVALSVASELPRDEAFGLLVRALHHTTIGETSNLAQAIAATKHPDAVNTLRNHLAVLWAHPALWDKADSLNWVAFDATTCIAHLIELGAPPLDFSGHVRQLSEHVCPHNRDSCSNFLSKYYSWLKP